MSSQHFDGFNAFVELDGELNSWFDEVGTLSHYETGQKLILEGDINENIFLLVDGSFSVNTTDQSGQERCLAELMKGAIVGEMTWLENRPAVASVSAMQPSSALKVSFDDLNALITKSPNAAAELQRILAKKLALQINSQNVWIHRFSDQEIELEPLRKVLVFFAGLDDQDVNTLANIGTLRRLKPGDVLISQGSEVTSLYLILAGQAEVFVEVDGVNKQVGTSRRGELLGELSLLLTDDQGATATVQSLEGMELMQINKDNLIDVLHDKPLLAEHFYRSLSCMLSQRSRDQLLGQRLASLSKSSESSISDDSEELDMSQLGGINQAGQRFNRLCEKFRGN
tara:strand:+ start:232 stop:1254 length:1023 start_codon:yes stop_codon:yes gene_type:complete